MNKRDCAFLTYLQTGCSATVNQQVTFKNHHNDSAHFCLCTSTPLQTSPNSSMIYSAKVNEIFTRWFIVGFAILPAVV